MSKKKSPLSWDQLDKIPVGGKLELTLPVQDIVRARNSITSYKSNDRGFGKDFSSVKGEEIASGVFVLTVTREK